MVIERANLTHRTDFQWKAKSKKTSPDSKFIDKFDRIENIHQSFDTWKSNQFFYFYQNWNHCYQRTERWISSSIYFRKSFDRSFIQRFFPVATSCLVSFFSLLNWSIWRVSIVSLLVMSMQMTSTMLSFGFNSQWRMLKRIFEDWRRFISTHVDDVNKKWPRHIYNWDQS